ncbi:putative nucleotidyltransferase-like protein [Gramella sp. Hel_I_59]|uniref:nucleotidyltransferase family protein n=1 Tax=Gramella sp. Hel_I_59 TaxID=1249978 RepID=UPI00116F315A|nr:nucleotidyltransferase family protein [Gramella sp. Hel_I_59]TQI71970.1 putative nucleotidyltransferase-like protein [Gramella sp. Hel_I_59]
MANLTFLNREVLHQRHRLSHQQIDALLNENRSKDYLQEKYHLLFQVGEFDKITDAFRKSTIPFTPLKGPMLSYRLHQEASYRYSNDLDLLVSPKDIERCISILELHGYKTALFPWPDNSKKRKRLIKLSNQILLSNPENNINIEIHWKLFKSRVTDDRTLSEVIKSNTGNLIFQNRSFQIFDNELELLYLIIHGGKHAWFRLKWLVDVRDFLANITFDEHKFVELTTQLNATRMVALCNSTLEKYFPESSLVPCLPETDIAKLSDFAITQIEYEDYYSKSFLDRIKTYLFELKCFPGFRFKLSTIAIIFYGKYSKVFEFYRN